MGEYREAVMLSLLAISVLAVPAASEEIVINDKQEEGIVKKITTDLGDTFSFESSEGERQLTLRDQNTDLTAISTPEKQITKVQNAQGKLKSVQSANQSFKIVETPYGDLKTGFENGKRIEKFEGNNRSKVENIKEELATLLRQKRETMNRKAQKVVEANAARVKIQEDFDIPGINITNIGNETINLHNWKLASEESADSHEGSYVFENIALKPDEKLVMATQESNTSSSYDIRTEHIRLYDAGDRLQLIDEWGKNIQDYRYSSD